MIIYFRIFRWPLFQIFSNFYPSQSFRVLGTGLQLSFDESSPCTTYSVWESWEGFTEQIPFVNIIEKWPDLFQVLSAPLFRANTREPLMFCKAPQKSFLNCILLDLQFCHLPELGTNSVSLEVILQGRPVSIVTADDGKRQPSFVPTKDKKEGERETHARILLPFHLYIITVCVSSSVERYHLVFASAEKKRGHFSFLFS